MAAKTASRALALIAWLIAETWRTRAPGDGFGGNVVGGHPTGRRALAIISEGVAGLGMGDKNDTRRGVGVADDEGGVDALVAPQANKGVAEGVGAEAGEVGHRRPLAGRGDGEVGGVAAESLQVARRAGGVAHLVELQHRLADGDDLGH